MQITRRLLGTIPAALLAAVVLPRPALAQGAKVVIKVGGNLPGGHPAMVAMTKACARIRAESRGDIDINLFSDNLLGSETAMQSQVRQGALEMMTASGLIMQTFVPKAGASGMPFAFKDYRQVWAALDGDLGADMRADMDRLGIFAFPRCMDNGFRNITTSTKPINGVADLAGLKIRVPPSPVWVTMFTALGAAPASINLNELYTALQTKVVDAQENPLVLIQSGKFYEVQKYCSMTGHLWDGAWIIANKRFWQSVPADAQALIARVFDEEAVAQRASAERLNVELQAELTQKGLVFNRPDKQEFLDHLRKAGFFVEWQKKYGPETWAKLEKVVGSLS